ncbi:MAG: LysE family transporter [Gammaproteobacteria bacterium]
MNDFFAITLLVTLAAISPGPDFALVVKNSSIYSRAGGIATAVGISISMLFHASYCILGLGLIISKSILIFSLIKYLGAAYLIYIGIKSIFSKNVLIQNAVSVTVVAHDRMRALRQGFFCNLLNPKAVMFFVALFTMVVKPGTSVSVEIAYAIEIALIHLIWFGSLAIFLTHHKTLAFLNKGQAILTKVMGGFLVIFGVRIATLAQV